MIYFYGATFWVLITASTKTANGHFTNDSLPFEYHEIPIRLLKGTYIRIIKKTSNKLVPAKPVFGGFIKDHVRSLYQLPKISISHNSY